MRDKNTTQGNETMTSTQLTTAFLRSTIVNHMGSKWTVEGLLREDGSGNCFIVTLQNTETGNRVTRFIRTLTTTMTVGHPKHTIRMAPRKSQML